MVCTSRILPISIPIAADLFEILTLGAPGVCSYLKPHVLHKWIG